MTAGRVGWPRRLAGALLLLTPFVPLRRIFGPLHGAGALVPPSEWALGLAIFGVSAWLLVYVAGDRVPSGAAALSRLEIGRAGSWRLASVALTAAILVTCSQKGVRVRPGDESVVFRYRSTPLKQGSLVSGAALLLLAGLGGWAHRRRSARGGTAPGSGAGRRHAHGEGRKGPDGTKRPPGRRGGRA